MTTRLNAYINFDGKARQAMEFYHTVFGGKLDTSTFAQFGMSQSPADADKIMHAMLVTPSGLALMAADVPAGMPFTAGDTISMSLSGENEAELRGYWNKLAEGAQVTMPLDKAPWGDIFGMLTDRFGIKWMVDIVPAN
jgi:PhnB protein